jgi:hypothetical protein
MRIKMLETRAGADDRVTVKTYEKDKVYTVGDELGTEFIKAKFAVEEKQPESKEAADKKKGK